MAGPRSDSDSSPPRSKRRHGRSPSRSRSPSPLRAGSPSPPKRTRRGEDPAASRIRENAERSKLSRHERREKEPEREKERDREREFDRERDIERHKDKHREKERGSVKDREKMTVTDSHRDKGRDRDRGRDRERERERERGLDGRTDRDKERTPGNQRIRDRSREREPEREKEKARDSERGRIKEQLSRQEHSSPEDDKYTDAHRYRRTSNISSSPRRITKHTAEEKRDEMLKDNEEMDRQTEEDDSVAKMKAAEAELEEKNKDKEEKEIEKPSFEYSGKLAAETNRFRGITLQFTEPPEARKPTTRWRLYIFKDGEPLNEPLYIHRLSCYLFGRERRVADVPTDHPSCSKQHAVIQYRLIEKEQPDGTTKSEVRPYLMDLGSTNGTSLNNERIEPQRYYELIEKDTIKFGNSSREYVLLHENSSG